MAAGLQLPGHFLDPLPPRGGTDGVDLRRDGPQRSGAPAQLSHHDPGDEHLVLAGDVKH